jgi:hypothetical protein
MQAESTSNDAFEAEARRRGKLFFRQQFWMVLPIFGFLLAAIAIFVGFAFLVPLSHRQFFLCLMLVEAIVFLVGLNQYAAYMGRRAARLVAVNCPACGAAAHFETAALPDTQIYMVCPNCQARAGTGFKVPPARASGGRYSMGYDWGRRKKIGAQVIVRVRGRRGGKKKGTNESEA